MQNTDPVVWTNQRVLKWVRDIDLKVRGDSRGGLGGGSLAYANDMQINAHFDIGEGMPSPGLANSMSLEKDSSLLQ